MLGLQHLQDIAKSRLEEAQILHNNGKFDGARYLAGYAVEMALKWVITKDKLVGFPETVKEFKLYQDSKDHDLANLLTLAGKNQMKNDKTFAVAWDIAKDWNSEFRYRPPGAVTSAHSSETLAATNDILTLLGVL
ncbi:MAG: hypothetical protein RLZZ324_1182 [Candidatus Parcubacteria bacterium]|jgi:AbiV family abortive infection protein